MKPVTFERVLAIVIEEYRQDGHEVVEQEGVHYARLVLEDETGAVYLGEMNLTRLADCIVRRLA